MIASLIGMFSIGADQLVWTAKDRQADTGDEYVLFESMRIKVDEVIAHVVDQGSFPLQCYERMDSIGKKYVVKEIAMYAMKLIAVLNGVKGEISNTNQILQHVASPMLPTQLVKLHHNTFLREVLETCCWSHAVSTSPSFGQTRRSTISRRTTKIRASSTARMQSCTSPLTNTMFNGAWEVAPRQSQALRSFCNGLATVPTNLTIIESNFFILKWEMDENCTTLMHLSLEGIFQARQHSMLQLLPA